MKFEIPYKGEIYDVELFDDTNFQDIELLGASGFIFDDKGKLCLIKVQDERGWTLPGGSIEPEDNSPEDTLRREVEEEADLELKNIKRLGYWKSVLRSNPKEITYRGRFIAEVEKVKKQTIDPAYDVVPERIFIDPKDFDKHTQWGDNGEFQLKKALDMRDRKGLSLD